MVHSGLAHISKFLENGDFVSTQRWLMMVGASMPDTASRKETKMAHEPQEGKGVLFSNQKKQKPTQPDFRGQIMIKGEIVRIAAWTKKSQYGELFSLSVETPYADTQSYPKEVKQSVPEYDWDIPF